MDFFDSGDNQAIESEKPTLEPPKLNLAPEVEVRNLGVVTRRTITEYIEDSSESSSSDESSRDSSQERRKRKEKKKRLAKDKKKRKHDRKSPKHKKKNARYEDEPRVESGSKRRKISDATESTTVSSSMRNKLKMLELNLRNIKEDPRSRPGAELEQVTSGGAVVISEGTPTTKGWFEDTIGDQNNLQFGLYRGDVPAFYRARKVRRERDWRGYLQLADYDFRLPEWLVIN